jgi:hypothetical protein
MLDDHETVFDEPQRGDEQAAAETAEENRLFRGQSQPLPGGASAGQEYR